MEMVLCCAVLLDVGINKPDLVVPHYPYLLLCSVYGRQWAGPIHFYLAHGLGIDWIFSQMRIASFKIFVNRGRWQNIKVTCGFLQTVEFLFSVDRLRQNPSDSLFLSLESPAHLTHQKITLPTKCSHRRPT